MLVVSHTYLLTVMYCVWPNVHLLFVHHSQIMTTLNIDVINEVVHLIIHCLILSHSCCWSMVPDTVSYCTLSWAHPPLYQEYIILCITVNVSCSISLEALSNGSRYIYLLVWLATTCLEYLSLLEDIELCFACI